ncbi:MAG: glycosyltransferase family 2 protein [Candidatus Bathyarchaeia archaeon]|jgi:dolichol-phosphate mannosyltransferase
MFGQRFEPTQSTEAFIAALNEEEGVGATISELTENINLQRVLVIDGHSVDRTVEVAKDHGAEIIFQDGKGKGDALAKAIESMDENVKYVVITDADFTYPATYVPEMINILEDMPDVGMVCGNRFSKKAEGKAFQSRFSFGNKALAFAHSALNGVDLQDPLTGLRVIRADILRRWVVKSKGFDVEVELNHQVAKQGFKTMEVPIEYRERLGEKKLKMKHGVTILKRIMYESFV